MNPYARSMLKKVVRQPRTYLVVIFSLLIHIGLFANYAIFQVSSSFNEKTAVVYISINIAALFLVMMVDILVTRTEERNLGWVRKHYFYSVFIGFLRGDRHEPSEYFNDTTQNLPEMSSIVFGLFQESINISILAFALIVTMAIDTVALVFCLSFLFIFVGLSLISKRIRKRNGNKMMEAREQYFDQCEAIYEGRRDIFIYQVQNFFAARMMSTVRKIAHLFEVRLLVTNVGALLHHVFNLVFPLVVLTNTSLALTEKMLLLVFMFFFSILLGSVTNLIETIGYVDIISQKLAVPLVINELLARKEDIPSPVGMGAQLEIKGLEIPHTKKRIQKLIVPSGDKVAITGPIGSGKTTLFKCIVGIQEYECGEILLSGLEQSFKNIHYVSQDILVYNTSLEENCCLGKDPSDEYFRLISDFDLDHLTQEKRLSGDELSGGEKKRIGFVRFLINRRPLNLLDEVISEVDSKTVQLMVAHIEHIENTVILITHNQRVANRFRCHSLAEGGTA